jgi:PAS domain S-box-containing protein
MRHFPPVEFATSAERESAGRGTDPAPGRPPVATAWRFRPIAVLIICGIAMVLGVAASTALLVSNLRQQAFANSQRELSNMARLLAEHVDRQLSEVELVQTSFIRQMPRFAISSPEDFARRMSAADVHLMLRDKISGLSHLESIALISADGLLINDAHDWPTPAISVLDRDYFKALASDPQLVSFVSQPVRGRRTGAWAIFFARKVAGANGETLGLIIGVVRPRYFEDFFKSITLQDQGSIALSRNDGMLLVRYPAMESVVGNYFAGSLSRTLAQSSNRKAQLIGHFAGKDRLLAAHQLAHFPLYLTVGLEVSAVLAGWREEAKYLIGVGGLAAIAIACIFAFLVRQSLQRQRWSREKLREHKLHLDAALNNMSQGLCMFDAKGRLVLCNERYLRMYGLAAERVRPGCSLLELLTYRKQVNSFAGDPQEHCDDILARVRERKTATRVVEQSDGRVISIVNEPMSGGGWVATHEDITERRQAQHELDRNRELLNLIIENVPSPIVVKNARDFRYVLINRAAEQLWGLDRAEAIGKTSDDLYPGPEGAMIRRHDILLARSNLPMFVEAHSIRTPRNGMRIVTANRLAVRSEDGKHHYLVCVLDDITERTMIERQLQQAQKMEAVGNLTGGLAHDFNNLLSVIIGTLEQLQEDIAGNAAAQAKHRAMLEASLHGAGLTRQLLAFSRQQMLQPKQLDVNALVGSTMQLLARTLGETITYDLRLSPDLWPVFVDESQLQSALVNIAINARDAMPGGGTLRIATANAQVDDDLATRHVEFAPGDYVRITISDTGTGMAPEVVARIFEPFFTTKAPGEGSGLGLSMVYGFVKQSKGHISASSEVGEGTTFTIYLWRDTSRIACPAVPAAARAAIPHAKPGEVILAVDDNAAVRKALCMQLESLGYAVIEADRAQSALDRLAVLPRIDLLFTDVIMPGGMNGKDLARKARNSLPGLKVLFTSGFPGKSLADDCEIKDNDRLLSKPYRKGDLAKAVREVLDQPVG